MQQQTKLPTVILKELATFKKLKWLNWGETYIDTNGELSIITCLGYVSEQGREGFDNDAEKYVCRMGHVEDANFYGSVFKLSDVEKDLEKEVRVVNITITENGLKDYVEEDVINI